MINTITLHSEFQNVPHKMHMLRLMANKAFDRDDRLIVRLSLKVESGFEVSETIMPIGAYLNPEQMQGNLAINDCYFFAEKVEMKFTSNAQTVVTVFYNLL